MDRTERLLDLVALLLDAPEPVPFSDLREAFPDDYGGGRESAERKLERDKAELLQAGVPLEYVPPSLEDGRDAGGYRIDRAAFFLPDPRLAPEEAAALGERPSASSSATRPSFSSWACRSNTSIRSGSTSGSLAGTGSIASRSSCPTRS